MTDTRDLSKVNSYRVLAKLWNEGTMVAMAEARCQVSRPISEVPKTLRIWTLLPGPGSGPGPGDRSLTLIILKVMFSRIGLKVRFASLLYETLMKEKKKNI